MKEEIKVDAMKALEHFSAAIGQPFRVKDGLVERVDEVTGVDRQLHLVKGKKFGDYHVDYCQLLEKKG